MPSRAPPAGGRSGRPTSAGTRAPRTVAVAGVLAGRGGGSDGSHGEDGGSDGSSGSSGVPSEVEEYLSEVGNFEGSLEDGAFESGVSLYFCTPHKGVGMKGAVVVG